MRGYAAIAAYWTATFRGTLDEGELKVFEIALADVDIEDAVAAIDEVAALGGYPPTPQRIAELAEPHRKERARLRIEAEQTPALRGANRPVSFHVWLREYATDEEKAIVQRIGPKMRERLEQLDNA
jgi:hypothetical protein